MTKKAGKKPKASGSDKTPKRTKGRSKGKVQAKPKETSEEQVLDLLDGIAKKPPESVDDVMAELRAITKKLRRTSSMVCSEEEFRRKVEHLKTMCPIPKRCKVKVSRVSPEEMEDEHGYVTKERDTFEVIIANNLTEYETEHILLHEWAHVLCWRPYHPLQGDHGGDWGVWYATIWRKYHGVE